MNAITGAKLGEELLTALGIDATRVRSLAIICEAGEVARVEVCSYVAPAEGAHPMGLVLSQYELVPRNNVLPIRPEPPEEAA